MEPVECGPVRWPVFGLLTALALPAALCQMCVIYVSRHGLTISRKPKILHCFRSYILIQTTYTVHD